MKSPVKKEYVTQIFGANPAAYAQFGYKGHNGIDFRAFLSNGDRCYLGGQSEVFSPHDGKIIENALDTNGYGWYVKIESAIEGSVMGHFSSQSPKAVGTMVKEGDFIGYQGTTGNSTGIHLHWGYYKHPRDRQNGYGGFINQAGLYQSWGETTMPTDLEVCLADRQKFWNERDELYRALGVDNQAAALAEIARLKESDKQWKEHKCPEQPITPPPQPVTEKLIKTKIIYDKTGAILTTEKTFAPTNS
jgi:murein DD-endopeptidase MepM/ murein hydrolase activator NlpD